MTDVNELELVELEDEHDDEMTAAEAEAIVASAWKARGADQELARQLERPAATGTAATTRYLSELTRRPVLPDALERELVERAQAGDAVARARLVEAFLPRIGSVARLYRESPGIDRVELMQEGVVGLLRALERYDASRGVPFWAYAAWWVRQAMQQLVAELTRPFVLSDRALRQLSGLRDAYRELAQHGEREPTAAELAHRAGLSLDQVDSLLAADRPPRSLQEPLSGEEGELGSLGELIADPLADGDYEAVLEAIEAQELLALLSGLSDREREILRARHGLEDEGDGDSLSLRQVGERFGLSAERVRQIEQRALGKLAAAAGGDGRSVES